MVFHARLPGRLPKDADYAELQATLAKEAQPGDVLLLYPWWTERARLYAPDSLPVIGYLGSDTEDLTAHPRIWLLAQPHLPKSDLSGFLDQFEKDRKKLGEPRAFGTLELSLYQNGRYRPPLFTASEQLAQARVYLENGSQRIDCPWNGRAHQCPNAGYLRAQQEWHEVNEIPRHCLYFHPPGGQARMVVEFPNVPAADEVGLEGGIVWEYAAHHNPELSDVRVTAESGDGRELLAFTAKKGVETFYRESAKGPAQPFTLRLTVQADNPQNRQTCIDFFARGPRQGGTP